MDLFIFGTLLHVPLLRVVSGVADIEARLVPASRQGFAVARVEGQVFPMMHAAPGGAAHGVIIQGLDTAALARLDYYEKAFGYDRVDFVVTDAAGQPRDVTAYVPEEGRWTPAAPPDQQWNKDAWAARWGALTTLTAEEAMADMAHVPAPQMGARYPNIMARSASTLRAQAEARASDMRREDVTIEGHSRPYAKFFSVEEIDVRYRQFDGAQSPVVNRGVFVSVDCAIVLPYDPVRDRVLLIEQFRTGAYLRGDRAPWTVEPIAGRIDPGETPAEAAHREAMEETGLALSALHTVGEVYPTPGTSTEFYYIYVGLCDLPDDAAGLGGLATEAEDIRSHLMEWSAFDAFLTDGSVRLAPLLAAGHWLARNRAALRASA